MTQVGKLLFHHYCCRLVTDSLAAIPAFPFVEPTCTQKLVEHTFRSSISGQHAEPPPPRPPHLPTSSVPPRFTADTIANPTNTAAARMI